MAPTMSRYQGTCHGEDEKVFGGLDRGEGVGSSGLNSANRIKIQMFVFSCVCMYAYDYHVTYVWEQALLCL